MPKTQEKYINPGNLFVFAENRLRQRVKKEEIYSYSMLEIIDNAIKLREYLDNNPLGIALPNKNKSDKIISRKEVNRKYYLKRRRK